MENVVIFLYFRELLLTNYDWQRRKKNKMDIFVAEILDCMKGLADFEGSFCNTQVKLICLKHWLDRVSHFAHTLPITYVQVAILNLLNSYNYTALHDIVELFL